MKTVLLWQDGMVFNATAGEHVIKMGAKPPFGKDTAATPKELVAMGLGGCTAMDVIALLKKYKQQPKTFRINVDIQTSTVGQPAVFTKASIEYSVEGPVESDKLIEAVQLSQTKYCGVSAMLSKAFPIEYTIVLNGEPIGNGYAKFENN